ncbi:hypothetical protein AGR7C_pAt0214 [Agrobacterium deltaense Zutra 3/1]|uniref:Uncharacterized protein n=1 Tax=Agrobacterium deltaense Zutra 3/1 TaxID=1183427 RepID=A0A1S7S4Q7_9HYPH|nr:hypothetical protein AGR7C_pAt0214 [Agrobacterium deltaense Zutra 3/1]
MARDVRPDLLEHRHGGTDLPWRTVATLEAVILDERSLHRVQIAGLSETLDRRHFVAVVHHGQRKARVDAASTDHHRARPTLTVIAPLLGAGQVKMLAQSAEKGRPIINL